MNRAVRAPRGLSDAELARMLYSSSANCTDSGLETGEWFPASADAEVAREQAAPAIALCNVCPLQPECLEFSMRYWNRGGDVGVWAGLTGPERLALRYRWLAGESAPDLLTGRRGAARGKLLVKTRAESSRTGEARWRRPRRRWRPGTRQHGD